jgi:hypothetical protein
MPVFKPGGTIPIVLDVDAAEETPLTFVCSALSVNQANDLGERLDALIETPMTDKERQSQLFEIVEPLVKDWRNTSVPYSWTALLDNIGMSDLWALAYAIKRQIGFREKKVLA